MRRADPVFLLTAHVDQAVNPSDQSFQGSNLRQGGSPFPGLHRQAEPGNQGGVHLIRLGTNQLTLSKPFDTSRIDNADDVAGIMKIDR